MVRFQGWARWAFALACFLYLAFSPAAAHGAPPEVGTTAGKTYGEWSAAWWQWMFSIPAAENPQDAQGEIDCSLHQSGPVWFLAGADLGRTTVRSCEVPAGAKLFFPVLNVLAYNQPGETLTVGDKRAMLDDFFGSGEVGSALPHSCELEATINGQSIARFAPGARVQSPPFTLNTGDGPFGFPAGLIDREAVSEGYWMMLPPLTPGEHVLKFGGRLCQAGTLTDHPDFPPVEVTYHLDVVGSSDRSRGRGRDRDGDDDDGNDGDGDDGDGDDGDDRGGRGRRNVRIIESLYAAFAGGDTDTILELIDEDVIWIESEGIPYGGTFIGRDAVFAGVFGRIAEEWDDFTATVDDTFAARGNRVIVIQRDGGTFKATGKSMEAEAISIWTLDNGRVVRFRQVIDTQEVVSATLP
ncbi:MAG: nuclear transport factor 2 family protein [Acidobacteriota bacterium]